MTFGVREVPATPERARSCGRASRVNLFHWPKGGSVQGNARRKSLGAWPVEDVSIFCFEGVRFSSIAGSSVPRIRAIDVHVLRCASCEALASRRRICPYSRTAQAASCLSTRAASVNVDPPASTVNDYLRIQRKIFEVFFLQIALLFNLCGRFP